MEKLFVVIRSDLAPGLQLAQSGHAIVAFQHSYPRIFEDWRDGSNNLVILSAEDEARLTALADHLTSKGVAVARFHEPDLGDQMTAISVGPAGRRLLSSLPLAGPRPSDCQQAA